MRRIGRATLYTKILSLQSIEIESKTRKMTSMFGCVHLPLLSVEMIKMNTRLNEQRALMTLKPREDDSEGVK